MKPSPMSSIDFCHWETQGPVNMALVEVSMTLSHDLAHLSQNTTTWILIIIGYGNGILPDSTQPLPVPCLPIITEVL